MPIVEITSLIFTGMNTLAKLVTAYYSARKDQRQLSSQEVATIQQSAAEVPTAKLKQAKSRLSVIDSDILETINGNIDKEKKRLIDALKDPANSQQAKDEACERANSVICRELKRIAKLNGGKLPPGDYKKWWESHGCA